MRTAPTVVSSPTASSRIVCGPSPPSRRRTNERAPRGTTSVAWAGSRRSDARSQWSACRCEMTTASGARVRCGVGPCRRRRCASRSRRTGSVRTMVPLSSTATVACPHQVTFTRHTLRNQNGARDSRRDHHAAQVARTRRARAVHVTSANPEGLYGSCYVRPMRVDIWADLVCPWCYLGKRRFETALARFAHRDEVDVTFHSFQLDPGLPKGEKVSQLDLLTSKYGIPASQVDEMQAQLERTAAAEGLEYHLRGGMTGNTFDAHRLVHLAQASRLGDATVERFYRAHFTEQRSLFDHDSLVDLAAEAGLDPVEARRVLKDDDYADAVEADEQEARELGATGVPFFVIA